MGEHAAVVAAAVAFVRRTVATFGPTDVCLSFNGGKDSTVLFHLLREAFPDSFQQIRLVYFDQPNEFPEVTAFLQTIEAKYAVTVHRYSGGFKQGLASLLDETTVKAIYLGTRLGDPGAGLLAAVSLSDEGWPKFFRVHPVLTWTYADVWLYLAGKDYCCLYDEGFTSLGSTLDTVRNPQLANPDGTYRPACDLASAHMERRGRGSKRLRPGSAAASAGVEQPVSVLVVASRAGDAAGSLALLQPQADACVTFLLRSLPELDLEAGRVVVVEPVAGQSLAEYRAAAAEELTAHPAQLFCWLEDGLGPESPLIPLITQAFGQRDALHAQAALAAASEEAPDAGSGSPVFCNRATGAPVALCCRHVVFLGGPVDAALTAAIRELRSLRGRTALQETAANVRSRGRPGKAVVGLSVSDVCVSIVPALLVAGVCYLALEYSSKA